MKLSEIRKTKECPDWLKDENISVINEDIVIKNDVVIWLNGTWQAGIWESGIWKSGTWLNGIWKAGTWQDGIWKFGTWQAGTWQAGIWLNGTWQAGIWQSGIWQDGIWKFGTWQAGTWQAGIWKSGIWKSGFKSIGKCKWDVYYNSNTSQVKIGCIQKTVDDWNNWFNSNEEFETKRDTSQFKQIYQTFKLAEFAINIEKEKHD